MPRPRCCVRRATPPSHPAVIHELSQRDTDAFIFGERCADLPRRRTSRAHSLPPNSRRATPPICPDLIYDRHRLRAEQVIALTLEHGSEAAVRALTDTVAHLPPLVLSILEHRQGKAFRFVSRAPVPDVPLPKHKLN